MDLGGGPIVAYSLVELDSDGMFVRQRETGDGRAVVGADGSAVFVTGAFPAVIHLVAADGSLRWERVVAETAACSLHPSGDAVCAGQIAWSTPGITQIQRLAAADGALRWSRNVGGLSRATLATSLPPPPAPDASGARGHPHPGDPRTAKVLPDFDDGVEPEEDALAALQAAEVERRPRFPDPFRSTRTSASLDGFSLLAGVWIHEHDQDGLERLCRYAVRPPFALDRPFPRRGRSARSESQGSS